MKILKKLLPIIGLLYFGWTTFGSPRGVSYESTTDNVNQTNLKQGFATITNAAATASEVAIHNAEKKLVSTNAAGVRGMLSVPVFDLTDPGAVNIFPFWDDTGNEVDWTSNTALLTLLGLDSNDDVTFGTVTATTVTATTLAGAGGGITYNGAGNNGNLATSINTLQELNDAVDNLSLGGGGSAPTGTMVNSGASTQYAIPYYDDTTGTNMVPSLISTDATKTNLLAGGVNANVLTLTNLAQSLSNIGLGTEDSPTFSTVIVGTTNVAGALAGKQDMFTTGAGVTNIANVLSGNYTAGTNVVLVTNSNGAVSINTPVEDGGGGGAPDIATLRQTVVLFDDFLWGNFSSTPALGPFGFMENVSGAGANLDQGNGDTDTPGVRTLTTGTTTTGYAAVHVNPDSFLFGGGAYTNEWRIRIPTLPDGSETFIARVGFFDGINGSGGVDGVWCEISTADTEFEIVTRSNNSENRVASTTTVAANTWYKIRIVVNAAANSAVLTINDADSTSGTAATIPSGAGRRTGMGAVITKSAGTTARTMDIDYAYLGFGLSSAR